MSIQWTVCCKATVKSHVCIYDPVANCVCLPGKHIHALAMMILHMSKGVICMLINYICSDILVHSYIMCTIQSCTGIYVTTDQGNFNVEINYRFLVSRSRTDEIVAPINFLAAIIFFHTLVYQCYLWILEQLNSYMLQSFPTLSCIVMYLMHASIIAQLILNNNVCFMQLYSQLAIYSSICCIILQVTGSQILVLQIMYL